MRFPRFLKKIFWFAEAFISSKRYPLNRSLHYVGVTGTDGKTTTCNFINEIALSSGYKPLMITTAGAKFDGDYINIEIKSSTFFAYSLKKFVASVLKASFLEALKAILFLDVKGFEMQQEKHRTTPLSAEIRKVIIEYEKKGANFFILEITSHSLDQFRIYGIELDSAVITNITSEHLDYHGSWENYAKTKTKIIDLIKDNGSIALNQDCKMSYDFIKSHIESSRMDLMMINYKISKGKIPIKLEEFYINVENKKGLRVTATSTPLPDSLKTKINIRGRYNISNALAAFSCFYGFNPSSPISIINGIANLKLIPGRMQVLKKSPEIIVDFAHTSNGTSNALSGIKNPSNGRIWVIFGCAGERDRYKRPEMGKTAFTYADNILITSEDPRNENLFEINNEIISGFRNIEEDFIIENYYEGLRYKDEGKFIVRFDEPNLSSRKNAIDFAIKNARSEDIVLILGKGHETSMNYGGIEHDWDDIEYVKKNI